MLLPILIVVMNSDNHTKQSKQEFQQMNIYILHVKYDIGLLLI